MDTLLILLGVCAVGLVASQSPTSTCYHCYWYDEYNGGADDVLREEFDARGVEVVYTVNCKDNLDLVPTIQCNGDCVTLEFVSPPDYLSNGGFVNYISRTCAVGSNYFNDTDVKRESCSTESKDYFEVEGPDPKPHLRMNVTKCGCSDDLCNNKPLQKITLKTCYHCHYGTHNETIDPRFTGVLANKPGMWSPKCESPDSSLMSTIECPYDCFFYSIKLEACLDEYCLNGTGNGTKSVNVTGRGCWYDYANKQYELQPESCVDVLNTGTYGPISGYVEWIICICSGKLCTIGWDSSLGTIFGDSSSGANQISLSILLALSIMILKVKGII